MFMTSCKVMSVWLFVVVVMLVVLIATPAESIAIHPAVLKNFVGPYRVRQRFPILRQTIPFDSVDEGDSIAPSESQPEEEESFSSDSLFGPRQEALRSRKTVYDQERALSACRGQAHCRRNLDSTLNMLMKMMETGR